jgi:hypothetical protein
VIASFIVSINGSLTSTSIVILTLPFFSSGTKSPPSFSNFSGQFVKKIGSLFRAQVEVNLCFVMIFGESFGSGLVA